VISVRREIVDEKIGRGKENDISCDDLTSFDVMRCDAIQ